MSHTEGKWRIEKRGGHSDGVRPVITAMNVDRIAIISYRGVPSIEEADANALLISAAPELLTACKELVSFCESKERLNSDGVCPVNAYELAKAAIQSAGGGQE